MSTLANIIHNGVTVTVHIKEEEANEIELKNTGMDVVCNKEQTLQCAIIDKSMPSVALVTAVRSLSFQVFGAVRQTIRASGASARRQA